MILSEHSAFPRLTSELFPFSVKCLSFRFSVSTWNRKTEPGFNRSHLIIKVGIMYFSSEMAFLCTEDYISKQRISLKRKKALICLDQSLFSLIYRITSFVISEKDLADSRFDEESEHCVAASSKDKTAFFVTKTDQVLCGKVPAECWY
ncbi:hypothetical protein SAMN04515674_101245 [Pseudarcicella hirudinis]|uniref:Uncharacterized protein n=1 Tax=Pseudarcicella hirudinis TaxID=1079859 RepID=A0A1I5MCX4_9BACT|nr:hypothetical protein SAMN04515674_101245 [Pseudarcicella hirudinis]